MSFILQFTSCWENVDNTPDQVLLKQPSILQFLPKLKFLTISTSQYGIVISNQVSLQSCKMLRRSCRQCIYETKLSLLKTPKKFSSPHFCPNINSWQYAHLHMVILHPTKCYYNATMLQAVKKIVQIDRQGETYVSPPNLVCGV